MGLACRCHVYLPTIYKYGEREGGREGGREGECPGTEYLCSCWVKIASQLMGLAGALLSLSRIPAKHIQVEREEGREGGRGRA